MSCYFIARIKITDKEIYQKYIAGSDEIFKTSKGKYLVVDNNPVVLEGEWNFDRLVVIEFKRPEDFKEWYYSDEYQRILKYRLKSSICETLLVENKD